MREYTSKKLKYFKDEIRQYLSETTVHGFRYLVETKSNVERLIWVVVICISVAVCISMVIENVTNTIQNPIITNIETTEIQKVGSLLVNVRITILALGVCIMRFRVIVKPGETCDEINLDSLHIQANILVLDHYCLITYRSLFRRSPLRALKI